MIKRTYTSVLAPYIEKHILLKQACGFDYSACAYTLERFDKFCIKVNHSVPLITRDLVAAWAEFVPSEGSSSKSHRIAAVRQLSLYICSLGIDSYIPRKVKNTEKPIVYIPIKEEIQALFEVIDSYTKTRYAYMCEGYKIAFRLMYCCGLRISECCHLLQSDFNCTDNSLFVKHSKGDKDRLIYLSSDISDMLSVYLYWLNHKTGLSTLWMFPGKDPSSHVAKGTYDTRFASFWSQLPNENKHSKRPTPHALRHAFVVNKMNAWMDEGVGLNQMMPYLAAYLGHESPQETYYYYHQVQEAFNLIHKYDSISGRVIPEVSSYGFQT